MTKLIELGENIPLSAGEEQTIADFGQSFYQSIQEEYEARRSTGQLGESFAPDQVNSDIARASRFSLKGQRRTA